MGCEESFITIKPICHSYLVLSLGNCIHETPTKTGLREDTRKEIEGHIRQLL